MANVKPKNIFISIFLFALLFGHFTQSVSAETTTSSVLYIPLIGLTSVPTPLSLPNGAGLVTYKYAVKNFLHEVALTDVKVVDDTCSPVQFTEGDDNGDSKLDYSETWRYSCTTKLSKTTQSTAIASGVANSMSATHKAYATVVVGSKNPAPLVSIINITKVAYPLSLPREGGEITFTYKVNNPGVVPLSDVIVSDDTCSAMSKKLGDTNGNDLLDVHEVWIYTCTTKLTKTTTTTVTVTAFANGLKAIGDASLTIMVDEPKVTDLKIAVWKILSGVLVALIIIFVLMRTAKKQ